MIKRGNITGARRALATSLDTKPLAKMQDAAMEVGTVMRKQGFRAGTDMLKVAETPAELTRLASSPPASANAFAPSCSCWGQAL